ncbi:MAG: hypothetical protein J6J13_02135 [Clostridia bacterium]|nr:hypothetical protein [Clostridia bacterium]MBP3706035.1 hypothetical protein [Clostridia bacterium]
MNLIALISLLTLCAAIVFAFIFKVNTGIVSISFALILSFFVEGIDDAWLLKAFDSKMFLMLFGVMYLFCLAQENKTLELLAKKILNLCRGRVKFFPIILFVISAVISAIGPGPISVTALISVLIVAIAKETNTKPISLLPFGILGSFAGGLSPITPSGIVAIAKAEESGIKGIEADLLFKMALANVLYAVILYFFVFKWHKAKNIDSNNGTTEALPSFSVKQIVTLVAVCAVAAVTTIFGINVGLVALVAAVILCVFRCSDESAALKKVPWGTLIMITGVGILISLVTEVGGIDLLSEALSKLMGKHTATAIISILAGVMSWFSSASGVVMPTLIPTVPDLVQTLGTVGAQELVIGICLGAHVAAISPLSSCGGLALAACSSQYDLTVKERNRIFSQLFTLSAAGVLFIGLLGLVGLY